MASAGISGQVQTWVRIMFKVAVLNLRVLQPKRQAVQMFLQHGTRN
jgi:hypothetical protein